MVRNVSVVVAQKLCSDLDSTPCKTRVAIKSSRGVSFSEPTYEMMMAGAFAFAFLLLLPLPSLSATWGKYVYISERMSWHDAQIYCRVFHTDLAPVSSRRDILQLDTLASSWEYIWIGLERDSTDRRKWNWSGGGEVSTFFWRDGQPQNRTDEDYGVIHRSRFHDATPFDHKPFFCYSPTVVRERKTWEEAVEYCREHRTDLASVASETEVALIRTELGKNDTTGDVWIGLHFFSGDWLWVDGQTLAYEAWGCEGRPACPDTRLACVALQVEAGSRGDHTASNAVCKASSKHAWQAHNCEERLHFVCY